MASSNFPCIGFDMTFPNRNRGGSGVYARALLAELRGRADLAIREIAGAERGGLPRTLRWLLSGARNEANSQGVDLLHCPAFVSPWRSPVPLVITMHDAGAMRYPDDFPREWQLYNKLILPAIARGASAVITGTEASRAELARYYGISRSRIAVTHYGVDELYRHVPDPDEVASERARLAGGAPLLLFPGAPVSRKNLDVVLRAMSGGPPESMMSQAALAISGATEAEFPNYRDRIREQGLGARVLWLGRIAADSMPLLYAAADVVVYPSFYEGFGLPPLEAMAVGTPVVSSTASCLPEVLGDAALLVDPHDDQAFAEAVETILTRTEVRRELIARGKKHSARFTWARCAEETCEVYRTVLGARG